jgi:2-keto-4-pentenoate hydratase/2-oxohepta-3-ene-1,7-dioic acid hydratase in catechol pathway
MRLVSFDGGFGRIDGDTVVPMGQDIVEYLSSGRTRDGAVIPFEGLPLRSPVPRPGKIVCVGLNYRDHAEESGQPIPEEPVLFAKFANSILGPDAAIEVPAIVEQPDYEAELGVVIGHTARRVDAADALDHVAGYTCINDVSARDLQFRSSQWLLGKAIDGFLPVGPWIATTREVGDPQTLGIRCLVDGEILQHSSTKQMVFGVAELVAFISRTITLEPGDLIATGTPPGVGMARTPRRWLRGGDTVTVEIERIGALTNTVRLVAPRGGSR